MTEEAISVTELLEKAERYSRAIEQKATFSQAEFLEIGRVWNTLSFHTELQRRPAGRRFYELVRDAVIPDMVAALDMKVGRGYTFHSQIVDFTLGGIPDARFRYRLTDADVDPMKNDTGAR